MKIKNKSLLIFLCIMLCGCSQKETGKIIIEAPAGNTVARSYINDASKFFDNKDYNNALNSYLLAENVYSNLNYTDNIEVSGLYNMIGRCYMQLRDYNKAKDFFEKSLPISEKLLNEQLNFENYINLMKIYCSDGKNQELALDYGRKAEKSALNYYGAQSSELSEVYSNAGKIYNANNDYKNAEMYFNKALNIISDLYGDNHEKSAVVYDDLADMYQKQGKYEKAEEYLMKAEEIFKYNSNDYWLGVVYGDLGDLYCDKKDYESALTYYNQCLSIYKKLDNVDFDKAECQYNMAIAHFGLKDYEECKKDFLLAHQICESMSNKSELTEKLISKIKENLEIYYNYYYEGDRTTGFETWYKEFISTQAVQ